MRLLAAFLTATLALVPAGAHARPAPPRASAPTAASAASASPHLVETGHYRNVDGVVVHSPARTDDGTVPAGSSAQCRDASYSFSAHRRGTCSHHGGVARWL